MQRRRVHPRVQRGWRLLQVQVAMRRLQARVRSIRRYREAARDLDYFTIMFGIPWRRATRILHHEEQSDPERVRFLMDATSIRLHMQRFVGRLRLRVLRASYRRYLANVYRIFAERLDGNTWRSYTRFMSRSVSQQYGDLSDQPNSIHRGLIVGTLLRFWMQRFARGLRRLVERARRSHAYLILWRAMHHDMLPGETWRGQTRRISGMLTEQYGGVRNYPSEIIRPLMTATRQRFAMQRLVSGLRARVANSQRRVRRRVR